MKKILFVLIIALTAVSCIREDNDINNLNIKSIQLKVNQADWNELTDAGLNRYYSATFTIPEITNQVLNYGNVNAYILFDGSQQVLPYVRHYENAEGAMWTRTVDYEYLAGKLNIYVTNSDFIEDLPETMSFRLVIVW
jgi:hypothetical protein